MTASAMAAESHVSLASAYLAAKAQLMAKAAN